jgi:hypothetical protein
VNVHLSRESCGVEAHLSRSGGAVEGRPRPIVTCWPFGVHIASSAGIQLRLPTGPGPHLGALAFLLVSLWAAIENAFTHYYVLIAYTLVVVLNLDLRRRRGMTNWKRVRRLWTLLTTEEVFDEHGSRGRRKVARRAPRN